MSDELMTGPVKLYTTVWCGFCQRALQLLKDREIPHENVDLTEDNEELNRKKEEHGHPTVPIILIGGELLGGHSELVALDSKHGLDHLK